MAVIISGTTGISGNDGSQSTPAVTGTDTNTGVFFPTADALAFAANGTEMVRVDSTGIKASNLSTNLYPLVSGTLVTLTNQTAPDFTNIPSWVKRITLMLSGVSTNGTGTVLLQIGDSGGYEITGYLGATTFFSASGIATENSTSGIVIKSGGEAATNIRHGSIIISNLTGNIWTFSGSVGLSETTRSCFVSYSKELSSTLDRLRLYVDGTQFFDAGTINILYE